MRAQWILSWMSLYACLAWAGEASHLPDITKSLVLEETGDVLSLRGVAIHRHFFQEDYIAAFYSLNPVRDPQAALADLGPKRMWIYCLRPISNMRAIWEEGFHQNNPPDVVEKDQLRISQFLKMIDYPLQEKDTIAIDFVPNTGVKIFINEIVKGEIKDDESYSLILKVWIGRQPPSKKFRKDLFNLS